MPTTNQLIRKPRKRKAKKVNVPALQGCPQKRGVVLQVKVISPKKPNSAKRPVARVRTTGKRPYEVTAHIPGEGNSLQEHASVLVRGGRRPDLPGVRMQVVRGTLDTTGVEGRRQGRSKYGAKRVKKAEK